MGEYKEVDMKEEKAIKPERMDYLEKGAKIEMNRREFFKAMPYVCATLSFGLMFSGVLGNKKDEAAYIKRWEAYCNKHCPGVLDGKAIITKDFIETMMRFIREEIT